MLVQRPNGQPIGERVDQTGMTEGKGGWGLVAKEGMEDQDAGDTRKNAETMDCGGV